MSKALLKEEIRDEADERYSPISADSLDHLAPPSKIIMKACFVLVKEFPMKVSNGTICPTSSKLIICFYEFRCRRLFPKGYK